MGYRLSTLFLFILILGACKSELNEKALSSSSTYKKLSGKTMGTFYNLTFEETGNSVTKEEIDSLLVAINQSVSTYIHNSTISLINRENEMTEKLSLIINGEFAEFHAIELPIDSHFINNYKISQRIFLESDGAFEPSIMPLVNFWGFGYTPKKAVVEADSQKVAKILELVGFNKFNLEENGASMRIIKLPDSELDFSGVAKGYAVDLLADYLKSKSIVNLMVDIGGEVYTAGQSPKRSPWKIGLNTPKEDAGLYDIKHIIKLEGKALASSGNYRNFHLVGDKKYGHSINPETGYPEFNDLLAVSVVAATCAEADAVATAAMVLGLERAYNYIDAYHNLEACFFFSDSDGNIQSRFTDGMSKLDINQ